MQRVEKPLKAKGEVSCSKELKVEGRKASVGGQAGRESECCQGGSIAGR